MMRSRMMARPTMAGKLGVEAILESDELAAEERIKIAEAVRSRRSELLNGLTRRQRTFVLEKLLGYSDKDAAIAAGYSVSVAENSKQRIWKPRVRAELERLRLLTIPVDPSPL